MALTATKLRYFSDNQLGISIPARGDCSDLLNAEGNKNDYDWLVLFFYEFVVSFMFYLFVLKFLLYFSFDCFCTFANPKAGSDDVVVVVIDCFCKFQ